MPDKPTQYTIEENPDGTFDVRRNGRSFRYDLDDLDEARLAARRDGATEVTLIETDGYRRKIKA